MSTNVFRVYCAESSVPLTVYAPNDDEAAETFGLWCAINMPAWSRQPARIEEVDVQWLADQPQLVAAVERARKIGVHDAVLLFRNHDAGWVAVQCDAEPIGAIAPPEPLVRAFEARLEAEGQRGVDALVFALDASHALQLYLDYRRQDWSAGNSRVSILEFSRWELTGSQTRLREEMDMGVTGVAGQSPSGQWRIYPPNHERAGGY